VLFPLTHRVVDAPWDVGRRRDGLIKRRHAAESRIERIDIRAVGRIVERGDSVTLLARIVDLAMQRADRNRSFDQLAPISSGQDIARTACGNTSAPAQNRYEHPVYTANTPNATSRFLLDGSTLIFLPGTRQTNEKPYFQPARQAISAVYTDPHRWHSQSARHNET
jgi:hypothetical protein